MATVRVTQPGPTPPPPKTYDILGLDEAEMKLIVNLVGRVQSAEGIESPTNNYGRQVQNRLYDALNLHDLYDASLVNGRNEPHYINLKKRG